MISVWVNFSNKEFYLSRIDEFDPGNHTIFGKGACQKLTDPKISLTALAANFFLAICGIS